jgi:hypothetical protein
MLASRARRRIIIVSEFRPRGRCVTGLKPAGGDGFGSVPCTKARPEPTGEGTPKIRFSEKSCVDRQKSSGRIYSQANEAEAIQAKVLTEDEARRIAANIAKMPALLKREG